jgi:phosphonate transport system substrate-binding protein
LEPLLIGAVAYDARVVPIWDGFQRWFAARGLPIDFVLFTNYERQVEAQLRGVIDLAWNSPLAWIEARRIAPHARAVAMRDTDQDLTSVFVVREDGPSSVAGIRRVGVGAADSPQATLIPLLHLAEAGVEPEVVHHDVGVGKHGDHIGGERDAIRALMRGEVDAACILDANLMVFGRDGTLPSEAARVLARTGHYDHCNFTVVGDAPGIPEFVELLLAMSFADPAVRPLMEMEGLTRWVPGRTIGYALLERAVERFQTLRPWLAKPR